MKISIDGKAAQFGSRAALVLGLSFYSFAAEAWTVTPIHAFGSIAGDGRDPVAGLTKKGGYLWGTTCKGGASARGTVYRLQIASPTNYNVMYNFAGMPDGACPAADLTLVPGAGGTLYGTTEYGGNFTGYSGGTIFKIGASAPFTYTSLYKFLAAPSDGEQPVGELTFQGGLLWGTTQLGGASSVGTLYNFSPAALTESLLYSFQPLATGDGSIPQTGLTYVPSTGMFFGTTAKGGSQSNGTIFQYSVYRQIHSFGPANTPPDGGTPATKLIKVGSWLFGTTRGNTFFKSTLSGSVVAVYNFLGGPSDGAGPIGDIVYANLGSGPRIYGTTSSGGTFNKGTVFEIDPVAMTETGLYSFTGGTDGAYPQSGLHLVTVASVPALYGAATSGGSSGAGTVFKVQ